MCPACLCSANTAGLHAFREPVPYQFHSFEDALGLLGLPGQELLDVLAEASQNKSEFGNLSAIATDNWPIFLLACRHWRLPVPPNLWIGALQLANDDQPASTDTENPEQAAEG
ncbi:MAG: hypothetical protein JNM47_08785 [Hyphomonadaceae bacterium]|nr:hypothetical protein [Hyphomonadaceae bacterium]